MRPAARTSAARPGARTSVKYTNIFAFTTSSPSLCHSWVWIAGTRRSDACARRRGAKRRAQVQVAVRDRERARVERDPREDLVRGRSSGRRASSGTCPCCLRRRRRPGAVALRSGAAPRRPPRRRARSRRTRTAKSVITTPSRGGVAITSASSGGAAARAGAVTVAQPPAGLRQAIVEARLDRGHGLSLARYARPRGRHRRGRGARVRRRSARTGVGARRRAGARRGGPRRVARARRAGGRRQRGRPPAAHREVVLEAVRVGARVLCEKPLATTPERRRAPRRRGARAAERRQLRLPRLPAFARFRELLDADELRVLWTTGSRLRPGPPGWKDDPLQGGALSAYGVHALDYARWLLGEAEVEQATVAPDEDAFSRGARARGRPPHATDRLARRGGARAPARGGRPRAREPARDRPGRRVHAHRRRPGGRRPGVAGCRRGRIRASRRSRRSRSRSSKTASARRLRTAYTHSA